MSELDNPLANTVITNQVIARRALDILRNENQFIKMVSRDNQSMFGTARNGYKNGSTIGIRNPNDYVLRSGPTAVPQSTVETKQNLVVAKQVGADLSFSNVELTLNVVDFSTRFIEPAINIIVGGIATDVISGAERIPNVVHNVDVNNNTTNPTFGTFARANSVLNNNAVPSGPDKRLLFVDPITMGNSVTSFAGLFNSQSKIADQYSTGLVKDNVIGMNWLQDQTVPKHTTGAYGTPPTVNGANQTGAFLTISASTGIINAGDIFTLPGVFGVNGVTKASTGQLRTFTVDAAPGTVFAAGTTSLPIYPPLTPGLTVMNAQGNFQVARQTTTVSPASGAALVFIFNAGETYRKNFVMHPQAITLAVVPLEVPTGNGVIDSYTASEDGLSVSVVTFFDGTNFQQITRMDVLYGYLWQRPEFACVIADQL